MKIMVVGGGGREHAIIKKLKENKNVTEIYAVPGNGGMAEDAILVDIGAKEIDKIVDFPHPLGPIMLTNSPSFTLKFIFLTASVSPFLAWYILLIFSNFNISFILISSYYTNNIFKINIKRGCPKNNNKNFKKTVDRKIKNVYNKKRAKQKLNMGRWSSG